MNGLAYGFHEHNQINFQNPASYSALDSLSFIFDAGLSLQLTNFKENGHKKNANNGNIEYINAAFRAFKHVASVLVYSLIQMLDMITRVAEIINFYTESFNKRSNIL